MKTGSISLITLWGLLTGVSSLPLAGQPVYAQTSSGTTATSRSKDIQPGTPSPVAVKTNNAKQNTKAIRLSAGLDDVVKLHKAGVDETVILAFIENSSVAYHPSAQEIIKLRELGISSPIITTLLRRGDEVRQRAAQVRKESLVQSPQPAAPAATASTQPTAPAVSAIQPASVYYAPSAYPVSSPTVVYATYPAPYAVGSYAYGGCYYPRHYTYYPSYYSYRPHYYSSCYPRVSHYSSFYPRVSFGVSFGGGRFGGFHRGGFRGGFRHCR